MYQTIIQQFLNMIFYLFKHLFHLFSSLDPWLADSYIRALFSCNYLLSKRLSQSSASRAFSLVLNPQLGRIASSTRVLSLSESAELPESVFLRDCQ